LLPTWRIKLMMITKRLRSRCCTVETNYRQTQSRGLSATAEILVEERVVQRLCDISSCYWEKMKKKLDQNRNFHRKFRCNVHRAEARDGVTMQSVGCTCCDVHLELLLHCVLWRGSSARRATVQRLLSVSTVSLPLGLRQPMGFRTQGRRHHVCRRGITGFVQFQSIMQS